MVHRPDPSRTPAAGLNLVDDQERIETIAELAQPGKEIRGRDEHAAIALDRFEEDSLTEAIARDLEARHGFAVIDDRTLRVAVSVSAEEGETQVVSVDEGGALLEDEPEERYRSMVLDVEKEDRRWGER